MAIDRGVFLEIVKDAYSAYYTILPVEEGQEELPLAFRAEYNVRDEQYFFVKSANIWKNEKHEYCFVFSAPSFDPALAEECIDFSLKEMLPKVKPHKEHQYTNCKVILIADTLDDETIRIVRKKHEDAGPTSKERKLTHHDYELMYYQELCRRGGMR